MDVRQRPTWIKDLANRQFKVKRNVSFLMNTELDRSTTYDAMAESKADKGSDGNDDHTSIDVEQLKSSVVELPEMQLSELAAMGASDVLEQDSTNLNSEFATLSSSKKNKVYVAPVEDKDFDEA